jgi:hypothetical protein
MYWRIAILKVVLNEQELIDQSLLNKTFDENNYGTILRVLAKHYFSIGMDQQQVKDTLVSHIRVRVKQYIHKEWNNRIDYAVKSVKKYGYELVDIREVIITMSELTTLKSINDNDLEKIAFVYLIYGKIFNQIKKTNDNWVNIKIKEVLVDAKINKGYKSTREQQRALRILNELGILRSSRKVDNTSERVCFIDEASEPVIKISDFRDYVLEYLKWKGENVGSCESCFKLIQVQSNRKKYCNICWKDKWKQYNAEKQREYRNKKL